MKFPAHNFVFHSWNDKEVTAQFVGQCVVCHRNVYQVNNEDPDPRCALTEDHSCSTLTATEYDMVGPDVHLCFNCSNTRERYAVGYAKAIKQWKRPNQ